MSHARFKITHYAHNLLHFKTANASSSLKKKGNFERLHRSSIDGYNLAILEDSARRLLIDEEFEAVMRHVKSVSGQDKMECL